MSCRHEKWPGRKARFESVMPHAPHIRPRCLARRNCFHPPGHCCRSRTKCTRRRPLCTFEPEDFCSSNRTNNCDFTDTDQEFCPYNFKPNCDNTGFRAPCLEEKYESGPCKKVQIFVRKESIRPPCTSVGVPSDCNRIPPCANTQTTQKNNQSDETVHILQYPLFGECCRFTGSGSCSDLEYDDPTQKGSSGQTVQSGPCCKISTSAQVHLEFCCNDDDNVPLPKQIDECPTSCSNYTPTRNLHNCAYPPASCLPPPKHMKHKMTLCKSVSFCIDKTPCSSTTYEFHTSTTDLGKQYISICECSPNTSETETKACHTHCLKYKSKTSTADLAKHNISLCECSPNTREKTESKSCHTNCKNRASSSIYSLYLSKEGESQIDDSGAMTKEVATGGDAGDDVHTSKRNKKKHEKKGTSVICECYSSKTSVKSE